MKIDFVLHSSNSNPMYLDFWPLVSKVWTLRFGIRPLLIYIDEDHSIPIDTTYGGVLKLKPVPGVPVYLQCLWVRYWMPTQFPDKVCMISDIDMFPISKSYFIETIASIPDDKYVHLYTCPDYLPSCYHVAKGRLFQQVLDLPSSWEESLRRLHAREAKPKTDYNGTIEFLKDKPQWGVDEEYATQRVREYPDRSIFIFVNRTHKRIDRDSWEWTEADVLADVYADSHSLRPYRDPEHRPKIDRLLDVLTRTRGLKQILHKRA
jgi:hypothetical protein